MADPEVNNGPTAKLIMLEIEFGEIKAVLAQADDAWLEVQAVLETESETAETGRKRLNLRNNFII